MTHLLAHLLQKVTQAIYANEFDKASLLPNRVLKKGNNQPEVLKFSEIIAADSG